MRFFGINMSAATTAKETSKTPQKTKYGIDGPRTCRSEDRDQIVATPAATVMKMIRRTRSAIASTRGVFDDFSNVFSSLEVSTKIPVSGAVREGVES
jgi:hypothetical protein